ncbi:MAG: hypothetical protein C0507_11640 [Cyanobacteria bacterium PR.3.49]|nr:hypothetical protein [Cyanobacteria bacterium PR.3.49]
MTSFTAKTNSLKTNARPHQQRLHKFLALGLAGGAAAIMVLAQAAEAQKTSDGIKIEKGKTPATIFTIEVPGPARKTSSGSDAKSEDAGARERNASQFFKDKQKATISPKPSVKEATMRLSGSLCPSCLKALAARFQNTAGVISATVELPSQMKASETETSNEAGKLPRYANARVTYDSKVLSIERIKDIVRTNDLAFWKVEVTDKQP